MLFIVPTAPSPPRMLTMTGEPNGSTIELNWFPPLHPNGAVHYEIEYIPAVTPGDPVNAGSSSSPYFTLTLPNEFLTYNVRVAAVNDQGQAQSDVLAVCPGTNRMRGKYMCRSDLHIYSKIFPYLIMRLYNLLSTDLQPPTGMSVVITGIDTAVVSWNVQQSRICDVVVGSYSVRYQLTNDTGSTPITVYTPSTSVILTGLVPKAVYNVSVATITLSGDMSAFYATTPFTVTPTVAPLPGKSLSIPPRCVVRSHALKHRPKIHLSGRSRGGSKGAKEPPLLVCCRILDSF